MASFSRGISGAFASNVRSSVVLPCPLRPIRQTFSPRINDAVKAIYHFLVAIRLADAFEFQNMLA